MRAMCCRKVRQKEQVDTLELKEIADRLAKPSAVRWCGHALRKNDDSVLRIAINLEVTKKTRTIKD